MSNESNLNIYFPVENVKYISSFLEKDLMNIGDVLKYSFLMNDDYMNLYLNQDSTNDPSLDESVDLPDRLDSMEVDDNDQMMIESNQPSQRKTYTFLPKKLPKDKPKGKQKDIGSGGITYPIVVIEQNISDYDDDGDADGDNSESVDDELNFTEENPNESSSSGFDAPETDDIYDDIEVRIILVTEKLS
uniref:Uncharacterized protein n=1 Tax=Rhizophagus irregularis (strain DAOM 181602 / DAOM 197198 / MUCL 43194) TaxID=747089 RepID=U9T8N5_RHIID